MALFPILLAVHVALALALLVPAVLGPFALRAGHVARAAGTIGFLMSAKPVLW